VTLSSDLNETVSWWVQPVSPPPAPAQLPLTVRATETDFVEVVLAMHACGVFPTLTQEAIIERMRRFCELPLQNWQQLGANIRRRRTLTFLERLLKSLEERNEDISENGNANRRPKFPGK
jgi:hypothetical protein